MMRAGDLHLVRAWGRASTYRCERCRAMRRSLRRAWAVFREARRQAKRSEPRLRPLHPGRRSSSARPRHPRAVRAVADENGVGPAPVEGPVRKGSVLNFVYLPWSMRCQILKRRSVRRTFWRTDCGPGTVPGHLGHLVRRCGWRGRSISLRPHPSGRTQYSFRGGLSASCHAGDCPCATGSRAPHTRRRAMGEDTAFGGVDEHKETIAVGGRRGPSRRRGALSRRDRELAGGIPQAGEEAGQGARHAAILLRGRSLRLWHPSQADRHGPRLRVGRPVEDARAPRRPGQDRPARCGTAGAPAPGG